MSSRSRFLSRFMGLQPILAGLGVHIDRSRTEGAEFDYSPGIETSYSLPMSVNARPRV